MDGWLTSQDVCELAGVSYRALDYWVRVKVLRPISNGPGSGRPRGWTDDDAASACIAAQLRREGCDLPRIRLTLEAWCRDGCPRSGMWLIGPHHAQPVPADPAELARIIGRLASPVTLVDLARVIPAELRQPQEAA